MLEISSHPNPTEINQRHKMINNDDNNRKSSVQHISEKITIGLQISIIALIIPLYYNTLDTKSQVNTLSNTINVLQSRLDLFETKSGLASLTNSFTNDKINELTTREGVMNNLTDNMKMLNESLSRDFSILSTIIDNITVTQDQINQNLTDFVNYYDEIKFKTNLISLNRTEIKSVNGGIYCYHQFCGNLLDCFEGFGAGVYNMDIGVKFLRKGVNFITVSFNYYNIIEGYVTYGPSRIKILGFQQLYNTTNMNNPDEAIVRPTFLSESITLMVNDTYSVGVSIKRGCIVRSGIINLSDFNIIVL